jgi:putative spermidine/putrescine transport system permease protein
MKGLGSGATSRQSLSTPTELVGKVLYYAAIWISVFLLAAPIIIVVGVAFNATREQAFPPKGISLRWFMAFFNDEAFRHAFFQVSLPIAVTAALLATSVSVLAAYALVRYDVRYNNAIQVLLISPIMIPGIIIGLSLLILFARVQIIESSYLKIIIGHTVRVLPYPLLTSMTSLYRISEDVERASRNLGATQVQTFYRIVLPLMKNGLLAGFLLAFIVSFADVNVALFLTGGETLTVPVAIFNELRYASSPIIAAISTLQILLILVMVLVIGYLVGFEAIAEQ